MCDREHIGVGGGLQQFKISIVSCEENGNSNMKHAQQCTSALLRFVKKNLIRNNTVFIGVCSYLMGGGGLGFQTE